jgi:2-C-methyl-D-erythritol 4-phosphate cytidylyltransferase
MGIQSQMEPQHTGNERVVGIVLAAGLGSRFALATETPKQFLDLGGEPVLVRSLRAVLACRLVEALVCAVPPAWRKRAAELLEAARLPRPVTLVEGGATRQESARRSLEVLARPAGPDLVLLHDAARPLVPAEVVEAAILAARAHGAAVVAAPSVDTIATTNAGFLDGVLDRSVLVNIQTPQAFRYSLIRDAHRRALEDGISDATDDAALVLRLGRRVAVAPGPATNIKITCQEDLELARVLLSRRTG